MDLTERARAELVRLGEDPDLIIPVIKVIDAFEVQGFDPLARRFAVEYLHLLLREKPLSVLTDDPAEWVKWPGTGYWRSRRNPDAWSSDEGKSYWLVSEAEICEPERPPHYVSAPRDKVVIPETYRDALKLKNASLEQSDPESSPGGVGDIVGEG